MVRKIATVVFFIALLALALWQSAYISETSEKLNNLCDTARDAALKDDMSAAYAATQELNQLWQQDRHRYQALLEHIETDQISEALEKALGFSCLGEQVQFTAEMNSLSYLLQHVREIDSLSIDNLF